MKSFDIFVGIIILLIIVGLFLILRRRNAQTEHKMASLGMAIGLVVGGAVGLGLSAAADSFVIIMPGSVGVGMGIGLGVGTLLDSRQTE